MLPIEAQPRLAVDISECRFYHTMDLPRYGLQKGTWNLIGRFDDYVGHHRLEGQTVLDIGTATGFLTFESERRGAIVTSFDVDRAASLAFLPIRGSEFVENYSAWLAGRDESIERMKNAYWLCHRELESKASCFYGDVYALDEAFGTWDVVLMGQILVHVRDGIAALTAAAKVCRKTIIIVEGSFDDVNPVAALCGRASMPEVAYAWYHYSFGWYREVLAMLGFSEISITTSRYSCDHASHESEIELATIVGKR